MICAAGELLIDFTEKSCNEFGLPILSAAPGGAPANFLSAVKNAGLEAAFIGKVGNDAFGKKLTDILKSKKMDVSGIMCDDNVFTTLAFVTLSKDGERSFSFARKPGADTCLRYEEVDLSLIDRCTVFHFGSLSFTDQPSKSAVLKLADYAKSKKKLISYDPNYRAPLWKSETEAKENMLLGMKYADIVKMSSDEAEFIFSVGYEKAAETLINEYPCSLVFVTLGKDGCYFRNKNCSGYAVSSIPVSPVDTTGAGDIFAGTAVSLTAKSGIHPSELSSETLHDITEKACTIASLSTEKHGGML